MNLPNLIFIFSTILVTVLADSGPPPAAAQAQTPVIRFGDVPLPPRVVLGDVDMSELPRTAAGFRTARRPGEMTNGERFKRGLPPARPRKLYEAIASAKAIREGGDLAKRQAINAPAKAVASGSRRVYNFVNCYNNGSPTSGSTQSLTLTFTSTQDLANQCAAAQDKQSASGPQSFFIRQTTASANCFTAATAGTYTTQACSTTAANLALYQLQT